MARYNLTDDTPVLIQASGGDDLLSPQVLGPSDVLFLRTQSATPPTNWDGAYRATSPEVGRHQDPFPLFGLSGFNLWAIATGGRSTVVDGDA